MKEIATAMLFIAAAHMFCVPALDDIQAENTLPIVKVEVEEERKTKGTIELQLADWCSPCRKFKAAGIIDELKENGWEVKFVSNLSKKYPTFRVTIDGKSKTWSGYSSKSRFYGHIKSFMNSLGYDDQGRKTD